MRQIISISLAAIFSSSWTYAAIPVSISSPVPAIASSYSSGTSQTVVYTITSNVPKALPLSITGISAPITRIKVSNDCGSTLLAARDINHPSSCSIGINITPNTAGSINQTLKVNYQGRTPLKKSIVFKVTETILHGYVADKANIWLCSIYPKGSFNTCNIIPVEEFFGSPVATTFASVNGV